MMFGGPLAEHMAVHIVLMTAAAPVAAAALRRISGLLSTRLKGALAAATLTQLGLLWAWHTPAVLTWALGSPTAHGAMQLSLFLAALWFWSAVLNAVGARRWRAIFALLITGKLFCLLGVLLVFSPRLLYPAIAAHHGHGGPLLSDAALADQHLGGLLMVVACPLSYVLAGTIIAAKWVAEIDADRGAARPARRTDRLAAE